MSNFIEGWVDCGCAAGLQWGGEEPRQCSTCRGSGMLYRYRSGALALHRGGPFAGQDSPQYPSKTLELLNAVATVKVG